MTKYQIATKPGHRAEEHWFVTNWRSYNNLLPKFYIDFTSNLESTYFFFQSHSEQTLKHCSFSVTNLKKLLHMTSLHLCTTLKWFWFLWSLFLGDLSSYFLVLIFWNKFGCLSVVSDNLLSKTWFNYHISSLFLGCNISQPIITLQIFLRANDNTK